MENPNKWISSRVTILRNLFTKEFVDNVNSGLKRLLARLWGVRPGSKPSENQIKAINDICHIIGECQVPKNEKVRKRLADVFRNEGSDKFLTGSDDTDVNWEYHHKIPGNGGSGSASLNCIDQQFPFFIVDGFAAHKDEIVLAAEVAFGYNCNLAAAYYLIGR
ncbi:9073_t:CDS:2 [Funneliformis caledonium]|uniref:9073_t:CDS:1 n=1 Tax=Funneliformis caledonium TaxID=1117310 RepID=A0A9N8V3Z3_9GLOM|nr:9073_t:CDS:2 [Funneliformis caledonium]